MKINLIVVGKLKERYLVDGIKEYSKRLSRFCDLNIIEIPDIDNEKAIKIEGRKIVEKMQNNAYNIGLVIEGKILSSVDFSKKIEEIMSYNNSSINFIIGGSNGMDIEVINKLDFQMSFSALTFPHQLMRLVLLEQVYRAFKIMNNEVYHK